MSESPEAIRADIERTRIDLSQDVDALADKVNPSKIADRQTAKIKGAFTSVRDRVMGTADDARSTVSAAASDVATTASDVAHTSKAKAEGSPLAVGLIAFGAGLLVAALIPASGREQGLAAAVKDKAQPVVDEVVDAVKHTASELQQPAQDAVAAVGDRAREASETIKTEAADAASSVQDRASQAQGTVREN